MKKVILVLSCILGGILLLILIGVFIYNNVWIQSFHSMKPDKDSGMYSSAHMFYDNGTFYAMHEGNNAYDIVTPFGKKTVERSSENFKSVFPCGYSFEIAEDKLIVNDDEGNILASFSLKDIMCNTDISDKSEEVYLYRSSSKEFFRYAVNKGDNYYYLGVDMDTGLLYVEQLIHNDVTTAVFYIYSLETTKLLDTYEAVLCDNVTQGVTMERIVVYHDTVMFDDYIFFMFHFDDYHRVKLYRHDLNSGDTIVVGEYEDTSSFAFNKSNIYYTYYNEYDDKFYDIENGIWKMDIDTLETTLVTKTCYDRELLCTENYIYAYKDMDIRPFPEVPTLTDVEIERGYDVKQIAISN